MLGLIKFWEKLVTHHYTCEKAKVQFQQLGNCFNCFLAYLKVCINIPAINIILKFNMDHEVGSQSQWNKIRLCKRTKPTPLR